ncbi:MAG: M20/M25/M40 family metallo-hydrolase [Clostridiales bacterium]|nr:M20/M25/M40 family metallo-hydrolase [Clostridiales bacterium]
MNYFLYLLLFIAAALVISLVIAVIRALLIKAKPNDRQSAQTYTREDENKYAQMLSAMVKVPTVSANEGDDLSRFYKLQSVMEELFPLTFKTLEKTVIDGNLLLRWKGRDSSKDGILLMGHQDVVPAAETTWKKDPFSGEISDGKVHGRGAMDCKCTVMAEFAAVEELLEEGVVPERDVYLSSSVNEETSGGGAEKIVNYLLDKGIRLCVVMDEGGGLVEGLMPGMKCMCAAAGITEKGSTNIKFIARSKGGHSSTPPKNTPITRLSKFVVDVEKRNPFKSAMTMPVKEMFGHIAPYLSFPLRLVLGNLWLFKPLLVWLVPKVSGQAGAFFVTTRVFTMSGASKAPNVIPDEAYVILNIRPALQQSADECIDILTKKAKKYDLEVEVLHKTSASEVTDPNSDEFKYLEKCVNDVYPQVCFTPLYCTGGTDCRKYTPVSDNCIRFCPIRMDADQLAAMHAANENISTDAVAQGVKFYKYFIKNHD